MKSNRAVGLIEGKSLILIPKSIMKKTLHLLRSSIKVRNLLQRPSTNILETISFLADSIFVLTWHRTGCLKQ